MINLRYKEPRIYKGVTLLSYASEIDEGSLEQIINCAELPNVEKIIITPDVHSSNLHTRGLTKTINKTHYYETE